MAKLYLGTREITPAIYTGGATTTLSVIPTTSAQNFTPTSPYIGYSSVSVSAVTSSIDANITAGNIKKDVTILGVTGTHEGGSTPTGTINITTNGTHDVTNYATANVNVQSSDAVKANYMVLYDSSIVDKEIIAPIGNVGLDKEASVIDVLISGTNFLSPFQTTTTSSISTSSGARSVIKEVHIGALTTVSTNSAFRQTFVNSTNLVTADLSGIETISGSQGLNATFQGCTALTKLVVKNIKTIGSSGMGGICSGCTNLTQSITFDNLSSIASSGLATAFQSTGIVSLYFPALTSTSFGTAVNQFNNMLRYVTGCTVHFPSNLQSVIGSWTSVTGGFGGTNTTVLFDLPATT